MSGHDIELEFVRCAATAINRPFDFSHLTGSIRAILLARRSAASAVVAHGPTNAAWYGLVARLLRVRIPILAHTFNFQNFPSPAKRRLLSFAFRLANIQRFVVYSTMERELYANAFGIPPQRFDIVLWGTNPPTISTPGTPAEAGDYACAIGGNARDYRTLFKAARRLPQIRFVVVMRPENLRGLEVPSNVLVRTNIPFEVAMNVVFYSKFMVLPLVGTEVPCGHVTIVCAMHLSKAYVITDSAGVRDYAKDQINSLTVKHGSVDELVEAVVRLWKNPEFCARLGENGQRFAAAECTDARIAQHFGGWLQDNHIRHLG
jgi:glycosyltransferase involved in cell wall biosynthesis